MYRLQTIPPTSNLLQPHLAANDDLMQINP